MSKELGVMLVAVAGLAGLAGLGAVIAAGASKTARLDAPMCKVAGKVTQCPETDFSRYPPSPISQ